MIVILTQDLMMSSSVSSVARVKELPFKSATSVEKAISLIQQNDVSFLIIDLQMPNLDLAQLMEQLKGLELSTPLKTVAYAQHVHTELLETARELEIDHVLTRGQAAKGLESILN